MLAGTGARRPRRGFTLIEMLVTLVVVALVAAILGQTMLHLGRVERLLAGSQLHGMAQAVRVAWVRALIDGTLPGQRGAPEQFQGSEREIQGFSVEVPSFPENSAERYTLRLQTANDGSRTQLLLVRRTAGTEAAELPLLDWPGRAGRFRFAGEDGRWVEQWPASGVAQPQAAGLPAAIALETGLDGLQVLIAAPRADAEPLPSQRMMEQL